MIELGYITKLKKGVHLNVDSFESGKTVLFTEEQEAQIKLLVQNDTFKNIIDNTKWENVTSIDKYLLAIVSGTINKSKQIKVEENIPLFIL